MFEYCIAVEKYSNTQVSNNHRKKRMEQHKNDHSELDIQKYYGKNTNYVIEELRKQGQSSNYRTEMS